jgi:hypothetical protein
MANSAAILSTSLPLNKKLKPELQAIARALSLPKIRMIGGLAPNLSLMHGTTSVTEQPIFFVGYGAILSRRTVLNLIWFWLKKMRAASATKLECLIPKPPNS